MIYLDFDLDLIRTIAENRTPLVTVCFQLFTWLGEMEGYILVVAAIYGAFDKRLAFRWIGLDPRCSTVLLKILRTALGVALVMGVLLVLDTIFGALTSDGSVLGNSLRYLRYFTAGIAGMLAAPYLYVRFGWAGCRPARIAGRRANC